MAGGSLREMFVRIMFRVNSEGLQQTNDQMEEATRQARNISDAYDSAGASAEDYANRQRQIRNEMYEFYRQQRDLMRTYRMQQLEVEHSYLNMARQAREWGGTTATYMEELERLGLRQRQLNDRILEQNEYARIGFIRQVATMRTLSTQSSKISANYERMGNALYNVNRGALAVTHRLEQMANRGSAASLALEMLGPTASMKQLRDMTGMINQGLMRFQMVAMAAVITSAILYTALVKAAMGPKPEEVRKQQEQINNIYKEAFADRMQEIRNFVGLFDIVEKQSVNKLDLTKALQSQVNAIRTWMNSLKTLTKRGVDEGLIAELQKAGPASAAQVQALSQMTNSELNKYVALWREKGALARQQTMTELEKLRQETQSKIQALQATLKPLGLSVERFKSTWAEALKPFIDMVSWALSKVVDFGIKIGEFFNYLNGVNPILTKMIFSFFALIPAMTLILSPLAIGIGLLNGYRAAFFAVWTMIKPLVIGFATMQATTMLVIAAVVLLVTAFYLAYTRLSWFRDGVNTTLAFMKMVFVTAFNFIKGVVMIVFGAILAFARTQLAVFRQFWAQNGQQIMAIVKFYFAAVVANIKIALSIIKGVFQMVWPVLVGLVKIAWNNIRIVISTITTVILGLIRTFLAIFRGDWKGAWNSIKQIFVDVWNNIKSIFKSTDMVGIGKSVVQGMINGIKSMAGGVVNAIKGLIPPSVRKYLPDIFGGGSGGKSGGKGVPKFAKGGVVGNPTLALVGEGGDTESIIPHNRSQRSYDLWAQAGQAIGAFDKSTAYGSSTTLSASGGGGMNVSVGGINVVVQGNADNATASNIATQVQAQLELYFEKLARINPQMTEG